MFNMTMPAMALPAGLVIALALSWLVIRLGVTDGPDGGRKDQARPVPTLGGLAIAGAHVAVAGMLLPIESSPSIASCRADVCQPGLIARMWPFAPALAALALGALDDLRPVSAGLRLMTLAALCLLASWLGMWLAFPGFFAMPGWAVAGLIAGSGLYMFVLMNATNFMDGSNAIAMGSAAIMLASLGWLVPALPVWILIAAISGFLVLNLAGKLYAGDAGALYVGFWIAGLGLIGAAQGAFSIWIPPLIALPFLTDVFMTLIWRARRRENLLDAHRSHAYQLLRRAGWGHLKVATLWWVMTGICGALAMLAVAFASSWVEFGIFAAALALSIALWLWQRAVYWKKLSSPG